MSLKSLLKNSIFSLDPSRRRRQGVRLNVTSQSGETKSIRCYKVRRHCSTIRHICIQCGINKLKSIEVETKVCGECIRKLK